MEDRRSDRFGRYEILSELGRGAMGIVYKARDPKINRVVAVKTISLAGQPPEEELEFRERFFREAEAAGRLSHPGIVTIFDVGEEPETRAPYIVMEYVGGQSLDAMMQSSVGHKLSVETSLQLALELAEALDCAHGQGVVHRDLKPANVLLTQDGKAKIADFGVAKLNFGDLTHGGRALGTPAYMSPEQLNGDAIDGRSDIFSLGVILYTMLTGHRPFQGNSAITISYKVVNRDPVPATVLDAELPPGLDYIIDRAMAKDAAQRYQRGMEMAFDIQHLREGREPWSKAKQPSPSFAPAPNQASRDREREREKDRERAKLKKIVAPVRKAGTVAGRDPVPHTSAQVRDSLKQLRDLSRKTLVVGAFCLIAALAYGVWVVSFGPRASRSRAGNSIAPTQPVAAPPRPTAAQVIDSIIADATPPSPTGSSTPSPADNSIIAQDSPITTRAPGSRRSGKPAAPASHNSPAAIKTVSDSTPAPVAAPTVPPAMLEIEVDHRFAEAKLSVWVDDHLSYTHPLEGTDKKRLVVFHHVQGHELHAMQVPAGNHHLRVRVTSDAVGYDQSATVTGEFASKQDNVLQVTFDKHGDINLNLQ